MKVLCRIVKDNPQRVAFSGSKRAYAVTEIRAVVPASALRRTITRGDDHRFTLLQSYHLPERLRPWTLLHQQQLPAGELLFRTAEAKNYLEGKDNIAVQVLMQAIEIAGSVVQQQRRRPLLAARMAMSKEFFQFHGKLARQGECGHPIIGRSGEAAIQRFTQLR